MDMPSTNILKDKQTMTAWRIHQFGSPDSFVKDKIAKPSTATGELLVRVKATSVNPIDYVIRSNIGAGFIDGLPATLHMDVAGVVEETGEEVTDLKEGDEIYACAGGIADIPGALADYMIVDAKLAAKKSKNISFPEAAALPLVSITAWEGLIDKARIHENQTVLVHGATGGVGHIGIQLAKWKGAEVFTTASTKEKMSIGHKLGAEHAINYKDENVEDYVKKYTGGKGFDLVFDTVGGKNLRRSVRATKQNGTVVSLAVSHKSYPEDLLSKIISKGITLHGVIMVIPLLYNIGRIHHGEILSQVAQLVEKGDIKPLVDQKEFTFNETSAAHKYAASGKQIGKVVLQHPNN